MTKENTAEVTLQQTETKTEDPALTFAMLLHSKREKLTADYKNTIAHTGSLLTSSMVYAYSKAINDAIKLITKEMKKDEKTAG